MKTDSNEKMQKKLQKIFLLIEAQFISDLLSIEEPMNTRTVSTSNITAQLSLLACAILWSTGGILIKSVEWSPICIAGFRSFIGAIVILAFLRKPKFHFSFAQIAAALAYASTMILFVWSTRVTTAANAILLQYAAPVWVALLAGFFLKEKAHRHDWITLVIVVASLIFFFIDKTGNGNLFGDALGLASGVTFALFAIFMRMQKESSSLESFLIAHIVTTVIALPFIITTPPRTVDLPWLLLLGIFQVGIASLLFARGIREVPALQSLLITTAEPILNPVWVFLILHEIPSINAAIAGGAILAAVTVNSIMTATGRNRAQKTA